MGGNLAWSLRLSDGTEYRMDRFTGAVSELIINPDFFQENGVHISDCLKTWVEMKDDWTLNNASGNFQLPMTPVYAPYPFGLKPSEYGIVITDFQNKVVLSNQQYTSLNSIPIHWVRSGDVDTFRRLYPERYSNIMRFETEGKVSAYSVQSKNQASTDYLLSVPGASTGKQAIAPALTKVHLPGTLGIKGFENVLTNLPDDVRKNTFADEMILDTSPFSVETFLPDAEGWIKMLARVIDLGFSLSDDEMEAWAEQIQTAEIDEKEDT